MDIISVHYKDIRTHFTNKLSHNGLKFDDDTFNDAFIKCANHFKNECITYDEAVKYFYTAVLNTIKGSIFKETRFTSLDNKSDDVVAEDESDYEAFAKYFYDTTMDAITEAFNENDMMIYSLYKYHGWTKSDLINAGYDCNNFDIRIKNIHRFVKEYTKRNKTIKYPKKIKL